MAEIKQGILGGVSGKIGSVVGAIWRGKNTIRTVPRKRSTKVTEQQLQQRHKFKLVSNFLQPFNFLLKRYFGSEQGYKSRVNLALAYHLREAVEEGAAGLAIQLEKVILSKGVLPAVSLNTTRIEEGNLILTWTNFEKVSLGKDTDLLTVVVYGKNSNLIDIFHRVVTREATEVSLKLLAGLDTDDCFIWYFVSNELDTESSTSRFISSIDQL